MLKYFQRSCSKRSLSICMKTLGNNYQLQLVSTNNLSKNFFCSSGSSSNINNNNNNNSNSKCNNIDNNNKIDNNLNINENNNTLINNSKLIYTALFAGNLKWLKRISVFGTVVSVVGMPFMLTMEISSIPYAGQIAIASTALFTSVGSTIFLKVITHPYVTVMHENFGNNIPAGERQVSVKRFDIVGREVESNFLLSEVIKVSGTQHPFATFKAKDNFYYIFGGNIKDDELRLTLTNEPTFQQDKDEEQK